MTKKKRSVIPLSHAMQIYYDFFRADPSIIDSKIQHFFVNQAVRSALNCGMVKEVKGLLSSAGDGPNATALRDLLARGGRPPFGAKDLVTRIGRYNQRLKKKGINYDRRIELIQSHTGIGTIKRVEEILSEFRKEETARFSDISSEYIEQYRVYIARRNNGEDLNDDEKQLISQIENHE